VAVAAGESSPPVRADRSADRVDDDRQFGRGVFRDSPIPLHFQLRALLLQMVENGEVRHDRPLPPERRLAAQFGVSLAPVRQAILDLVKEGVLYRIRGKGTFLRERRLFEQDAILGSFSENMRAKGLKVEMRILRSELCAPSRAVREALETAERRVWSIQRLALVEDEPTALLTANLSRARFPDLGPKLAVHGSLNRVLEDEFGISPRRADFTVEVGRCTTGQSSVLQVPPGSSILVASGTTYGVGELPVEHFQAIYRSDRVRLRLDTYRYLESVVPYARRQRPPKVRKVES
jgi:GntR family transcriptional regulator